VSGLYDVYRLTGGRAMGNPENIRAHLWAEHDWNRPFGSTPDRVLRELHRQMAGREGVQRS
jgi:hypothetical protein